MGVTKGRILTSSLIRLEIRFTSLIESSLSGTIGNQLKLLHILNTTINWKYRLLGISEVMTKFVKAEPDTHILVRRNKHLGLKMA